MDLRETSRRAQSGFIKAFSCSYSIARTLSSVLQSGADRQVLSSVVGLGSGVAAMGDTCGVVNAGVMTLGGRFPSMEPVDMHMLCGEFYRRLERRLGEPGCGVLHGGKHLASDLRRAILTGKTRGCVRMVGEGATQLVALTSEVELEDRAFAQHASRAAIEPLTHYFEHEAFHCCHTTLHEVGGRLGIRVDPLIAPSQGFCGGIGFNGTLCGALVGGVLCLGLKEDLDLDRLGYRNTIRMMLLGLARSGALFTDEKAFLPGRLFQRCQTLYRTVESKHGSAHCCSILALRLDNEQQARQYVVQGLLGRCREVVETVSNTVVSLAEP